MSPRISRRTFFLAGSGAVVAATGWRASAQAPDVELAFIQVSDTHVSKRRLVSKPQQYDVPAEESVRRTQSVVKSINDCPLPYSLIVHTGDVAHTRDTAEDFDLARELLKFERKAYYVPGNHDVGYSETEKFRPAFEERFGRYNIAFQPAAGLRLVLFDSQPLDYRAGEASRQESFRQLDKLLEPRMPTILFCHSMGLPSFYGGELRDAWPEATMARWANRMKEGGVFAVLTAHFHRDELHVVQGVPFYLCPPVINFWGRQTTFRHWTLSRGVLTYRTVYVEV